MFKIVSRTSQISASQNLAIIPSSIFSMLQDSLQLILHASYIKYLCHCRLVQLLYTSVSVIPVLPRSLFVLRIHLSLLFPDLSKMYIPSKIFHPIVFFFCSIPSFIMIQIKEWFFIDLFFIPVSSHIPDIFEISFLLNFPRPSFSSLSY